MGVEERHELPVLILFLEALLLLAVVMAAAMTPQKTEPLAVLAAAAERILVVEPVVLELLAKGLPVALDLIQPISLVVVAVDRVLLELMQTPRQRKAVQAELDLYQPLPGRVCFTQAVVVVA